MSRTTTLGLCLASAVAIASVRGALAETHRHVKESSDIYVLPPPSQVVTLSLGYHAALADILWAHVLVSQGLHTQERRRFENLSLFLDSINALDPTFRDPYLLSSALFTFQTTTTPREEVLKARAVMERGVQALPFDGELWLALGQFVAFLGPSYLTDPAEQAAWRLDGARMLARAAELGGDDASISWRAIVGAGILYRAGERDAAIRFFRRTLAVTDDPELKEYLVQTLAKLDVEQRLDVERRMAELCRRDLPFVKATAKPFFILGPLSQRGPLTGPLIDILGPPMDPWACAGPERADAPGCALTWRSWAAREPGAE